MVEYHQSQILEKSEALASETAESQQKYEFLLELCQDGILILQDGKIRESNYLMAKMCGYAVEEVLDTELASFLHPDDMQWMEKIYARVIDDANAIEIHETAFLCKNGIKIFAEVTAGQFVYNQQPAVLFMVREINDRVQASDEQGNNNAIGSMAALSGGIRHDYNHLLNAIVGKIVTHLGYDVEYAHNGSEALNEYKKALDTRMPYDAVILNLTGRGEMGGIETIQKLLELDPGVNAIVSSGYASQPDIMDFEQHGFKGFVAKPYTVEELRETLEQVLPTAA
jgi:PAS domain S-box-containing protein